MYIYYCFKYEIYHAFVLWVLYEEFMVTSMAGYKQLIGIRPGFTYVGLYGDICFIAPRYRIER